MSQIPSDVKDYSERKEDTHFNGVPSMYGKLVDEQRKEQPKYCWVEDPNFATNGQEGEHRNTQVGP